MSINVIDKIKPLGIFPVADAEDIDCNGTRLDAVLNASAVELSKKASKTYVDEQIAGIPKGDVTKEYVDDNFAKKSDVPTVPTKTSQLQNDSGFLTQHQPLTDYVKTTDERLTNARPASDVSAWAKSTSKPTYTKSEIGLSNVDNTSDMQKPVSEPMSLALANKASVGSIESLSSRITSNANNINVQKERIDALVTTTTSGDEVTDIRVDYKGNMYDNAGDAVRGQAKEMYSEIIKLCFMNADVYPVDGVVKFTDTENNGIIATIPSGKIEYNYVSEGMFCVGSTTLTENSILVPYNHGLVVNTTVGEVSVMSVSEINASDYNNLICCFFNRSGVQGAWHKYVADQFIKKVQSELDMEAFATGDIYPYNTDKIIFTEKSDSSVDVIIPGKVLEYTYVSRGTISIGKTTLSVDTYNVPYNRGLVLSLRNSTLSVMTIAEINESEPRAYLLCFFNRGGIHGDWEKYGINQSVERETAIASPVPGDKVRFTKNNDESIDASLPWALQVFDYLGQGRLEVAPYGSRKMYNVPNGQYLVIDMSGDYRRYGLVAGTVKVIDEPEYLKHKKNYIMLFKNVHADIRGQWEKYYLQQEIDSNTEEIRSESGIPDYYKEHISEKINEINKSMDVVNGISFAFTTDLHFGNNAKNSKYLLKNILDKSVASVALFGGDYPSASGDANDIEDAANTFVEYLGYVGKHRAFGVRGNHDFTIATSETSGITKPIAYAYNRLIRSFENYNVSIEAGKNYYYIDYPNQKTRIVMIDSTDSQSNDESERYGVYPSVGQEQVNWILNTALNVSDYHIIFVSHIPADRAIIGYDASQEVVHEIAKAIKNKSKLNYSGNGVTAVKDFASTTNEFVLHVFGHNHHDESNKDSNVLSVSTTCDAAYSDDGWGATYGTVSEQAFDVFCIDFDTKSVKTVRVGRGENREWKY